MIESVFGGELGGAPASPLDVIGERAMRGKSLPATCNPAPPRVKGTAVDG
jgi:hypothetical protein